MKLVIVEAKDGRVFFVKSGEIGVAENGSLLGFQCLKVTPSKRWAARFEPDVAETAASAINLSLDIGFYSTLELQYARVGARTYKAPQADVAR